MADCDIPVGGVIPGPEESTTTTTTTTTPSPSIADTWCVFDSSDQMVGRALLVRTDSGWSYAFAPSTGGAVVAPWLIPAGYRLTVCDTERICAQSINASGDVLAYVEMVTRDVNDPATEVFQFGTNTPYIPSVAHVGYAPCGGNETATQLYVESYRLDWAENGVVATPMLSAGVTGGPTPGTTGDRVTINGPVQSISWYWQQETAPVAGVLPGEILLPTVTVNGFSYVAPAIPGPIFTQVQAHSIGADTPESLAGSWSFQADNGAFIEIVVIRKVI